MRHLKSMCICVHPMCVCVTDKKKQTASRGIGREARGG